jgi:hypothetical protein
MPKEAGLLISGKPGGSTGGFGPIYPALTGRKNGPAAGYLRGDRFIFVDVTRQNPLI